MGLGKTIMVASLILTNTAEAAEADEGPPPSPPQAELELSDSDSSDNQVVAIKKSKFFPSVAKQARLGSNGGVVKRTKAQQKASTKPRATLVVAPMTLLDQWVQELSRSSKDDVYVLMYYGNGRTDLRAEIEAGVSVVVTSFGTLASEFKSSSLSKSAKNDKADKKRPKTTKQDTGLFGVEWFRIVLDEAHSIKSRSTLNAKASYALRGARRWCLTGTPIVK